jgi:hypothetical protein
VVSSTVRSPRFRHKNPTSVPPPTTPASTHCLSHATPQAQGPSLLELSGFAFRLQARRSPWPNRVRHPADCWLTSRCSPPCLAATQLRSISRAGERLPGGDSNPFVSVPSRAHKRPTSRSAGTARLHADPTDTRPVPALSKRPTSQSAGQRFARRPRDLNGTAPAEAELGRFEERCGAIATTGRERPPRARRAPRTGPRAATTRNPSSKRPTSRSAGTARLHADPTDTRPVPALSKRPTSRSAGQRFARRPRDLNGTAPAEAELGRFEEWCGAIATTGRERPPRARRAPRERAHAQATTRNPSSKRPTSRSAGTARLHADPTDTRPVPALSKRPTSRSAGQRFARRPRDLNGTAPAEAELGRFEEWCW